MTLGVEQVPVIAVVFLNLEQILREHIDVGIDCRCDRLARNTVHNAVAIHYLVLYLVSKLGTGVSAAVVSMTIRQVVCAI